MDAAAVVEALGRFPVHERNNLVNLLLLRGGLRHLAQHDNVICGEADVRSPGLEEAARRAENFKGLVVVVYGETEVVAVVSADTRKEMLRRIFSEDFLDDGVILLVGRFAEGARAFLVCRHRGTFYECWFAFSIFNWDELEAHQCALFSMYMMRR